MVTLYVNGAEYCSKKDGTWFIESEEVMKSTTAQAVVFRLLSFEWLPDGYYEVLQQAMVDAGLNNRLIMSPENVGKYCHEYVMCDNEPADNVEKSAIFLELKEMVGAK